MSDQVLSQILNQLQQMDKRFDNIDGRLEKIEDRLDTMDGRLDAIEEQTKTIPLLQQAVLETLEVTKRLEASQITFERKVTAELNTHQHSIDILNRRQLRMEADIEALKRC
ncbi:MULTISPECIES: hypothetical protein [Paenibacillus]|uniref:t-SNARE coiled-coil homology domain-containing protein n=1 Tax=Paenibacillus pabuli TaxID=1472 RepID=A0A855Y0J8_9BACL|nr:MULTISPECIES: hypothetical protein [Paenibacillus]PWW34047.1 hypothetical protein DET56_116100 [Paenibacillus pabuli]PXW00530.1 hypothetical protein DEU73_11549 [Paenibacillus taichungensis]RAJ02850.1 hypothetical protein DET54_10142 [Paenibacillus pabuli]